MMLIAASWPSKRDVAVTTRTAHLGLYTSALAVITLSSLYVLEFLQSFEVRDSFSALTFAPPME
jgi:hypothetical protein